MNKENKKNPYKLLWFVAGWSQSKINKNNRKFWEWEKKHNNFKL